MTDQDFRSELEISPPNRYARAGAHGDRDPARTDPARARFLAGQDTEQDAVREDQRGDGPDLAAAARRAGGPAAAGGQPRRPSGRFTGYPLRRRAERMRELGHADHAAAQTPRDELAAAVDYARRVAATSDEAGMHDAQFANVIAAAIGALMNAGDTGTAAMRTWRPEP